MNIMIFIWLLTGFRPNLAPRPTRSNGSGSKNGAERIQKMFRKPIIRPFRDHFMARTHN